MVILSERSESKDLSFSQHLTDQGHSNDIHYVIFIDS
jgi:hypothetical protein